MNRIVQGLLGLAVGALAINAMAQVAITPPNLAGAVAGTLPGAATVGPDGSSQYSVPLPVPPGTAGVVPTLGLQYSSNGGPDFSGLGWSLSGASEITRCMRTRAQDGSGRAVNLDAQDAYCLDGQRLILVSGTSGATAEFRTEVDDFSRITSSGSNATVGPDSWTVQTKSGMTITYGGSIGNATLPAPGQAANMKWSIARTQDRHGNYVSYAYEGADGTGEHFITQVRYTGNDSIALSPYNAVNFVYEAAARPDPYRGFFAGSGILRNKRLQAIETRTGTATDGSGGNLVRRWNLTYDVSAASGRSLLQSIQDCDAGGTCLASTSFGWTTRDPASNTFHAAGSGVWPGVMPATFTSGQPLDADGDGKQDLLFSDGSTGWTLCRSTGTAFSCAAASGLPASVASKFVLTGDFNGDGKVDIFIPPASGSTAGQICLSSGASFTCSGVAILGNLGRVPSGYFVGDLNGDGYDDVVVIGSNNTVPVKKSYFCLSSGSTLQGCTDAGSGGIVDYAGTGDGVSTGITKLYSDLNGDGRVDFVSYYSEANGSLGARYDTTTMTLHIGTDTGFVTAGTQMTTPAFMQSVGMGSTQFGDINSDGYPDITWGGIAPGSTYQIAACPFTGKSLLCNVVTTTALLSSIVDINAYDGTGVASINENFGSIHRVQPDGTPTGEVIWTAADESACAGGMMTVDLNGDGLPDVACYNKTTRQWTVSLTGYGSFPDLLMIATDGNALRTSFTYKGLADPTVYTPGTGTVYPSRDIHAVTPVVSKVSVDAASGLTSGATLDTTYAYSGMRSHVLRMSPLGFETVTATDVATGVATKTTFSQSFPTVGTPIKVETRAKSGTQLLSLRTDTVSSFATVGGAQFPYLRSSTTTNYDLDGTALPSTSMQVGTAGSASDGVDAYGNVTSKTDVVTSGADVYGTTTVNVFNNDVSAWMLGQLADSKITKTAPGVAAVTREMSFTYDTFGLIWTQTAQPSDPVLSAKVTLGRDPNTGVVAQQTQSWTDPLTSAPVSRLGLDMHFTDSAFRYPSSVANAAAQSSSYTYDPRTGSPTTISDPNYLTTRTDYDGFGRRIRTSRPDGTATTWAYRTCVDSCGYGNTAKSVTITQNWATIAGADQQTTVPIEEFFDARGRFVMMRTWDAAGSAVYQDSIYDAQGNLAKKSNLQTSAARSSGAYGWTTFNGYDALNRYSSISTTNSTNTGVDTTTYLYAGLLTTVTDAKSHATKRLLNGLGKVKQVIDAQNHPTSYGYDPFGDVASVTDPAGNVISIVLDSAGHKIQQLDKDLGTWSYVVDAAGRTRRVTDAKAQVTTISYDALDRMIERAEPDQDSRWTWDTAANGVGKLAESYTWIAATSTKDYRRVYSYDTLGRTTVVTTSLDWDYSALTSYDSYGRPATLTSHRNAIGAQVIPGSTEVQYQLHYNNQGAVNSVTRAGKTLWTLDSSDPAGRPLLETFSSNLRTSNAYNAYTGRRESIKTGPNDGAGGLNPTLQSDSYSYDAVGNLLQRTWLPSTSGAALTETFGYDEVNRLGSSAVAGVDSQTFSYDPAGLGNIVAKSNVGTYSYPAAGSVRPHMLSGIAGAVAGLTNPTFSYDANGNTVNGLNRLYGWSSANLPITIDKLTNGTPASASERYEFLYGPERQRTRQIVRAMSGTTLGSVQRTIYTAGSIEKEVNTTNGTTKIRTYLPLGLGYSVETFSSSSIPPTSQTAPVDRFFHRDSLGSLVIVTDGATGAIYARLGYDAWGRRRASNGIESGWQWLNDTGTNNTLDQTGYTGQSQLDDLGLVHLNGRVYDPLTGRMTSPDPTLPDLFDPRAINRATYVLNSPLIGTDPTGFQTTEMPLQRVEVTGNFRCVQCSTWLLASAFMRTGYAVVAYRGVISVPGQAALRRVTLITVLEKIAGRLVPVAGAGIAGWEVGKFIDGDSQWLSTGIASGIISMTGADNARQVAELSKGAQSNPADTQGSPDGGCGGDLHHICTDKNSKSAKNGGPWTPRFKAMFDKAGMNLQDEDNIVRLSNHAGPHPPEYHSYVYSYLQGATEGLEGEEYAAGLRAGLRQLSKDIRTPGSDLNRMLTKP